MNKKEIDINRKILADLAANNPPAFAEVVKFALA
jgi:ribosomal protein L20